MRGWALGTERGKTTKRLGGRTEAATSQCRGCMSARPSTFSSSNTTALMPTQRTNKQRAQIHTTKAKEERGKENKKLTDLEHSETRGHPRGTLTLAPSRHDHLTPSKECTAKYPPQQRSEGLRQSALSQRALLRYCCFPRTTLQPVLLLA